jgi:hypothetical protein
MLDLTNQVFENKYGIFSEKRIQEKDKLILEKYFGIKY